MARVLAELLRQGSGEEMLDVRALGGKLFRQPPPIVHPPGVQLHIRVTPAQICTYVYYLAFRMFCVCGSQIRALIPALNEMRSRVWN